MNGPPPLNLYYPPSPPPTPPPTQTNSQNPTNQTTTPNPVVSPPKQSNTPSSTPQLPLPTPPIPSSPSPPLSFHFSLGSQNSSSNEDFLHLLLQQPTPPPTPQGSQGSQGSQLSNFSDQVYSPGGLLSLSHSSSELAEPPSSPDIPSNNNPPE